jgi:division protein 1
LDFSEPYGTLVSSSRDDTQPRVWDLFSATEVGRLRGHTGVVKCVQVEDHVCLTGSEDGTVRIWDLRRVDDDRNQEWGSESEDVVALSDVPEDEELKDDKPQNPPHRHPGEDGACSKVLEGHTKAVTALYFEDDCLVCLLVLCPRSPLTHSRRSLAHQIRPFDNGTFEQDNVS